MTVSKSLVAIGAIAAALATNATITTAQTTRTAQAAAPTTRMQSDARTSECSRYSRAYVRLAKAKDELDHLSLAFLDTDDVKPKVTAIVTQLNDAETTVRERTENCPARFRV